MDVAREVEALQRSHSVKGIGIGIDIMGPCFAEISACMIICGLDNKMVIVQFGSIQVMGQFLSQLIEYCGTQSNTQHTNVSRILSTCFGIFFLCHNFIENLNYFLMVRD
ncbi:hypothetical protein Csa_016291 [Cucumis sativus]|uniref:Uncharacterized protein n=1 Tax=Cucumis sativus TaxID=3659 RepID=A0A0A0K9J8_CUCSA|nr:hypothetical protein Csa_016291 [Cucumis sativus]